MRRWLQTTFVGPILIGLVLANVARKLILIGENLTSTPAVRVVDRFVWSMNPDTMRLNPPPVLPWQWMALQAFIAAVFGCLALTFAAWLYRWTPPGPGMPPAK